MPVLNKRDGRIYSVTTAEGARPVDGVRINWRIVESSQVLRLGWTLDTPDHFLFVKYISGGTYMYRGVSRQRAVAAAFAESTGSYINRKIKPYFPCTKVRLEHHA